MVWGVVIPVGATGESTSGHLHMSSCCTVRVTIAISPGWIVKPMVAGLESNNSYITSATALILHTKRL